MTATFATTVAASLSVAGGLGRLLGLGLGASLRPCSPRARTCVVHASGQQSVKEKAAAGLTAAAMAAALVLPEVAEAAGPGLPPSLKNFLLSIGSGGVVLLGIIGAVVAVSNFDPVKRG
ncbi:hypothetical protein CFC21_061700 [Triticum aestivum]|uniref:Photosystem II reaction center X protein n=4 Tax=Triticinae TaxID=1648030 RepID=A0A453I477_AEGTS|nr:uncharacterized protein LOC109750265 [Aegilops tauschii subsp. strangulata]XP_044377873.1 uncharacterized protein LOC123099920 [Triticum aestivum]KAF7053894.1 hypothetical protein CFC21_061700 [Triticum aestivum]